MDSKNYLFNLRDLAEYAPSGLCPLLYHSLLPYIITISEGGWFSWVKKRKDLNFRKDINADDFGKANADCRYPNEVLVHCPNINVSVIAGLGPYMERDGQQSLLLRILNKKGACAANYAAGKEIILRKDDFKIPPAEYNARFLPALVAGRNLPPEQSVPCHYEDCNLYAATIETRCRYHKKKKGYAHPFLPGGYCLDMFHFIYPGLLSLLYASDKAACHPRTFHWWCPANKEKMAITAEKLSRFPSWLAWSKKILEKIFNRMFFPYDFIDAHIVFTVEKTQGAKVCPMAQEKRYYLNMADPRYPCPASLHALYPYMLLKARNEQMDWADDEYFHCPGCKGVIYRLTKKEAEH
ncbi:MAG: hypothetical protein V1662_03530 [Candidatus Omnitrophota bacterium]